MNQTIRISKAEFIDLEEILALQKKAYLSEAAIYDDYSIPPLHQTLPSIQKEYEDAYVLKAVTLDNQIVGSVRLTIHDGYAIIWKLIVDDRFQNLGIARKLLTEIEAIGKQKVSRLELFTGFRSEKNIHIYTSTGYKEFKREQLTDKVTLVYLEKFV